MKKQSLRKLCMVLALMMLFSMAPVVAAFQGMDGWAEAEVSLMNELALIPESLMDADLRKPISRLDMCRIAVLAYEKLTGKPIVVPDEHPFADTTDPDAEKAYAAQIINGNGNGTFRPDDPLSRLEFFVIVHNFLSAIGYPIQDSDYADLSGFPDAAALPEWGRDYTALTVGLGIVNGSTSGLNWSASASRQEGIVLFCRTYQKAAEQFPQEPVAFGQLAEWAKEQVLQMDELGLIPESVKYAAMNGMITRQNLCKVLMATYRFITGLTNDELGTPDDPFTDTDDLDVRNAYRLGIVNGKGNGIFSPDEPIIRQDFFRMTVNFLNAIGFPFEDDETVELSHFADADQISDYALGSVRLLVGLEIVNGNADGTLKPRADIVSQEALVVFYRVFCFVTGFGMEQPPVEGPSEPTEPPVEDPEPPAVDEPAETPELCQQVVDYAKQFIGCDYTYAGKNPDTGFDCSGFVYYVYKNFGYTLNPGATNQWNYLSDEVIPAEELRPGDLVFFSTNGAVSGMSHVGIYIGDGEFIHAENYQNGVTITPLSQRYYAERYLGAKRVIE